MTRNNVLFGFLCWACLTLHPMVALAQTAIAGVVKDTSGAVLPGVSVEAASPVLIEKVRTVTTDGQGQYRIVGLLPGAYTVTFALDGFQTVTRKDINLTTNFTATVNAELTVGRFAEIITVTSRSPVVDVQNVVQSRVVTRDVIDALPTGRGPQALGALIPGMMISAPTKVTGQDVGGSTGLRSFLAIHGGRPIDCMLLVDGLNSAGNMDLAGCSSTFEADTGAAQEFSYEVGAITVEQATGGVRGNVIPKEGGNKFAGTFFTNFTNSHLESNNLTPELEARGLTSINGIKHMVDTNLSIGGPVVQDRLWFFGSFRFWEGAQYLAGGYYNKNPPSSFVYVPNLTRPSFNTERLRNEGVRFTWQATPSNKLGFYIVHQARLQPYLFVSPLRPPEAAQDQNNPDRVVQMKWSSVPTNRIVVDAALALNKDDTHPWYQPEVTPDILPVTELSTGLLFRASDNAYWGDHHRNVYRASVTYVTGSHAVKTGLTLETGSRRRHEIRNGDMQLQFLNGVPRSVVVYTTPIDTLENMNAALGLYATDQWKVKRLTFNGGVRFDYFNASVPEQHWPAARFVGPRDFAAVPNVPNWTDLSPRLGVAYDLFGNGKTAVKVTLSRYLAGEDLRFASSNNPVNTTVNSATRTWTDLNGDFVPQDNEFGPLSNPSFGQVVVRTRYDPSVAAGFGARGYNWETSAGIQHELLSGVSVDATYFRRSYGNFLVADNRVTTVSDYDQFCITAPVDARLPGGGGNQICGLYDINPVKFRQAPDNLVTFASGQSEIYNGVDLLLNARLPRGARIQGGLNTGRIETDYCAILSSTPESLSGLPLPLIVTDLIGASARVPVNWPQQLLCHVTPPFQASVKLLGTIRLPWDLEVAAAFQKLPGPAITAEYVAGSSEVRASLGRDLSAGPTATTRVELIKPNTLFEDGFTQLDFRVAKIMRMGRFRVKGMLDLYNMFNDSSVLSLNTNYGPQWLRSTAIIPPRVIKFGVQVDF